MIRTKGTRGHGARAVRKAAAISLLALALLAPAACGNRLPESELQALAGVGTQGDVTGTALDGSGGAATDGSAADAVGDVPVDDGTATGAPDEGGVAAPTGGPATTAPTASGNGGGGRACTGSEKPIVIGTVGQQTGVVGTTITNGTRAVQAWTAMVNSTGGVNCHQIKYIVADDGGDPTRHRALVQQFVEERGVKAFVYNNALLTAQASQEYLESKGVPVIGTEHGSLGFYTKGYFHQGVSGEALIDLTTVAAATVTIPRGQTKLGFATCNEAAFCNAADSQWASLAPKLGYDVVYKGKGSLVQPDFTSLCINARDAGAQVLMLAFDATAIQRFVRSCSSVGYKPIIAVSAAVANVGFSNIEGAIIAAPERPYFLPGAALDEFRAAMRKYAPNAPVDINATDGWVSAKVFERAMNAITADDVSSAQVVEGLRTLRGDDIDGLTYPLDFSTVEAQTRVVLCGWIITVEKSEFTSDGKMICR